MGEAIAIRTVTFVGYSIRLSGAGDVHCAFCKMQSKNGDRCVLFGKSLQPDSPVRLQVCVDSEVRKSAESYTPPAEPMNTMAWTPRQ